MTYIFLGTPEFAAKVLEPLAEKCGAPLLVVTQPARPTGRGQKIISSPVALLANSKNWPLLEVESVNTLEAMDKLRALKPDLFLVVAFGQILKDPVLAIPRVMALNVHTSLLPKYRGAAPVQRAILNGDTETGITIQKIVLKLDAGDVLLQRKLSIHPDETSEELLLRMAAPAAELLTEAVRECARSPKLTPQDPAGVTYASKLSKEEARIQWEKPALEVHNRIRGLNPWPVAETMLAGERLRLFRSEVVKESVKGVPGTLISDGKSFLQVVCGDSKAVALRELQLENRKKVGVRDFLNAFRGKLPATTLY